MYEGKFPHKRYRITFQFLQEHIPNTSKVLDLGIENPFTKVMKENGYIRSKLPSHLA